MAKNKSTKLTALDDLFGAVCDYFKDTLKGGKATPADIKNAIQFLKDNGISALLSKTNDDAPMNQLVDAAQESGMIQFPFPADMPVRGNILPADDPAVKTAEGQH